MREIIKFANLTNATNKEKLFIVFDNADYLNFQSWNALLKTIEEPPSNTIIILILENIKRIPKTIISRCHLLKFNHLTNKNLEDYCIKKRIKIDINFLKSNEFLIRGSINRLNIIFEDENKLIINNAIKFMDGHNFIFEEFEKLYDLITKDNHKLKFLLIDLIYYKLKEIFINSDLDKSIRKSSLELLNFIKENFDIISIKDQKQEFLIIFMEYFRLKKMKKIYFTTPIYYVNDSPHIGHAYTSILCDVIVKFYKLDGKLVRFTTGTDEHGLKVERAAKKNDMSPNDFVDKVSLNFLKLSKKA